MNNFLMYACSMVLAGCSVPPNDQIARDVDPNPDTSVRARVPRSDIAAERNDRSLTQQLRQALLDDESTSTQTRNIRVTFRQGKVLLDGFVASEADRDRIETKVGALPDALICIDRMIVTGQ